MSNGCPACGERNMQALPYLDGGWPWVRIFAESEILLCGTCGLGMADPVPSRDQLNAFYQHDYRSFDGPHYVDFRQRSAGPDSRRLDLRSLSQISVASMFTQFDKDDCLLNLGPGSGTYFAAARQLLPDTRLFAIEHNEGAAEMYARRYGVTTVTALEDLVELGIRVKFAVLSHSLEHYPAQDVVPTLNRLREVMTDSGVVVVEVPHDDFRVSDSWRLPQTPHLTFFSIPSLQRVMELSGWNVAFINGCGQPNQPTPSDRPASDVPMRSGASVRGALRKVLPRWTRRAYRTLSSAPWYPARGLATDERSLTNLLYGGRGESIRLVATNGPQPGQSF